tara:strand:+ start:1750 stop:2289 length:540 start_codon:yes stop_codon:yes gene_type:complete
MQLLSMQTTSEPPLEIKDWHSYVPVSQTVIRQPHRSGEWITTPDIIICDSGTVSVGRALKALEYWKKLGYNFGTVRKAPRHDYNCAKGVPAPHQIMIDIPSQHFAFGKHIGTTKTWTLSKTGEIFKAKIEIVSGWGNSERVLEHEMGHALGWGDNSQTGHIMNGSWSLGGLNSRGLKRR